MVDGSDTTDQTVLVEISMIVEDSVVGDDTGIDDRDVGDDELMMDDTEIGGRQCPAPSGTSLTHLQAAESSLSYCPFNSPLSHSSAISACQSPSPHPAGVAEFGDYGGGEESGGGEEGDEGEEGGDGEGGNPTPTTNGPTPNNSAMPAVTIVGHPLPSIWDSSYNPWYDPLPEGVERPPPEPTSNPCPPGQTVYCLASWNPYVLLDPEHPTPRCWCTK